MLIKNGAIAQDRWVTVGEDEPVPGDRPALVSLARWRREHDQFAGRNAPLGIRLSSEETPAALAAALNDIDLIALDFPAFTDGRPYSTARLLRERYGYTGELRAVGQVLCDQAQFMARCGFDAFEVPDDARTEGWADGIAGIGVVYQPAADCNRSAAWLRQR